MPTKNQIECLVRLGFSNRAALGNLSRRQAGALIEIYQDRLATTSGQAGSNFMILAGVAILATGVLVGTVIFLGMN